MSSGFPAVDATCRQIGLIFDPWQTDLNRCIMGKAKDGLYAADTVVISIPRQVGKTWDVGAVVFALCIINPGVTAVWTAHRFKVARETFMALKGIALTPALAPHIDPDDIYTAAGNESITFRNGSRIVFAARERGAVRGFSEIEVLVLDEGQILTENALADLAPTTNQAKNPLILVMGTPPKPADPSEVFKRLRSEALAGESDGVLYVEFSAERGSDPDDRAAWKAANPSYPKRTSAKAVMRLRKLLSPDDFMREALGIWDDDSLLTRSKIDPKEWAGLADSGATLDSRPAISVEVSLDREWSTIGVAGGSGEKVLAFVQSRRGMGWVVSELVRLAEKHNPIEIALDPSGPAGSLLADIEATGHEVKTFTARDMAQACGNFQNIVTEQTLVHLGQAQLDVAIRSAITKDVGDAEKWDRREGGADISPLVAASIACLSFSRSETGPSVYESRGMVTL